MLLAKIRKFGGYMSNMVMPNLGAFVGWGIIAALFIPTGWIPNEEFNKLVSPMLKFMLPMLIGYTAGYNIYNVRGGVMGLFSSMGVIIGSEVPMFTGAMIMAPLGAWLIKKFDENIGCKVKTGFEMFVNNLSLGLIGMVLNLIGFIAIGPLFNTVVIFFSSCINWLLDKKLLPLVSIFMCPGQVLFLNNAINHGILSPIGYQQASELGKSIVFTIDSNCGPLLGTLCSIAIFGKGKAKKSAPLAMFISGIAGIGEVYFPFILANPIMILATMCGLSTSLFLLVLLDGGLVGMPSPGSLIMIAMMTPKDSIFANFIAILSGFVVAFLVGSFLLKVFGSNDDDETLSMIDSIKSGDITASKSQNNELALNSNPIKLIVVACDSGMGSSAMGASVLKKILNKIGIEGISVENSATGNIKKEADVVITLESLIERARISMNSENTTFIALNNFLKDSEYDEVIELIKRRNNLEEDK